jgi:hypothetical protein
VKLIRGPAGAVLLTVVCAVLAPAVGRADCTSGRSWLVFPAIAAGGAVAGGLAGSSAIELFNETRAFPFWQSWLLSSGAVIGVVATYAGLSSECAIVDGQNGWRVVVPTASTVAAALIPLVVWYLSPTKRQQATEPGSTVAFVPSSKGAELLVVVRF